MVTPLPIIPPLLVNNKLISDFREKANIFNDFFVQQCQPIPNNSILPTNQLFNIQNRLRDFDVDCEKILKLIRGLNPHKAYGHDGMLCNSAITKPLSIIYKNCLQHGVFPDDWKKGNIIPIHKETMYQCHLPTCSKIFEKLIFGSIYGFFDKNNLFNNNQSGFRPNDSCIHQLIAITHKIFSASDASPSLEVHGVFLSLSKVFDKVWHDDLLYKVRTNGIEANLFRLIKSFLSNRCQWVVLNGQSSVWKLITVGVPQGSVLGQLIFSFTLMTFL